jgi:hypothetical protein
VFNAAVFNIAAQRHLRAVRDGRPCDNGSAHRPVSAAAVRTGREKSGDDHKGDDMDEVAVDTVMRLDAPMVITAVEELRAKNDQLTGELAESRQETISARNALERFKVKVHNRALECKDEENWCTPGFNAAMRDLGLPEYVESWAAEVTVRITVNGTDDEDVARSWIYQAINSGDQDVVIDSTEIVDIEPTD